MLKGEITITGKTLDDLELALNEATRRIVTGNIEGFDRNETGSFSFEITENSTENYHANSYESECTKCNLVISYESIYGNKILTKEDFKPFKCPKCGTTVFPCDLCIDIHNGEMPCDKCPLEKR